MTSLMKLQARNLQTDRVQVLYIVAAWVIFRVLSSLSCLTPVSPSRLHCDHHISHQNRPMAMTRGGLFPLSRWPVHNNDEKPSAGPEGSPYYPHPCRRNGRLPHFARAIPIKTEPNRDDLHNISHIVFSTIEVTLQVTLLTSRHH